MIARNRHSPSTTVAKFRPPVRSGRANNADTASLAAMKISGIHLDGDPEEKEKDEEEVPMVESQGTEAEREDTRQLT